MSRKEYLKKLLNTMPTVTELYRASHFENDVEAMGAFKLAHLQAVDEFGPEWMGMTSEEFSAWMSDDRLPPRKNN